MEKEHEIEEARRRREEAERRMEEVAQAARGRENELQQIIQRAEREKEEAQQLAEEAKRRNEDAERRMEDAVQTAEREKEQAVIEREVAQRRERAAREEAERERESAEREREQARLNQRRAEEAEAEARELETQWVVRRREIQLTNMELGRGGWGAVTVANFRGIQVAAKCLYKDLASEYYQDTGPYPDFELGGFFYGKVDLLGGSGGMLPQLRKFIKFYFCKIASGGIWR